MASETIVEILDRSIVQAEAHFEAEKRDLLEAVQECAALRTRRAYLKSVETSLAQLHERRQNLSPPTSEAISA